MQDRGTIAAIASASGDFDLLVKALVAVEGVAPELLAAVSNADASLTVFAPTDAAFIALAQDLGYEGHDEEEAFQVIVDGLTAVTGSTEGALTALADVLAYHVAPEAARFGALRREGEVETLLSIDGEPATFEIKGRRLIDNDDGLDDPKVQARNIEADNGFIQVIDRVLIPIDLSGAVEDLAEPGPTIAEIAATSGDFDILVAALAFSDPDAGLLAAVQNADADLTVFAPTDEAFIRLSRTFDYKGHDEMEAFEAIKAGLVDLTGSVDGAVAALTDILAYHVSAEAKSFREIRKEGEVETLLNADGAPATFDVQGRRLIDEDPAIRDPRIVTKDIEAENGVIQAINRVLLPIDLTQAIEDAQPTIAEIAQTNGDFDILVKALVAVEGTDGLSLLSAAADPDQDLTVFAPTDAAFIALAQELGYQGHDEQEAFDAIVAGLTDLTGSEAAALGTLRAVLEYHISPGEKTFREIRKEGDVETLLDLGDGPVSFHVAGRRLVDADDGLDDPRVVIRNVDASNGKVQAIDAVLIPIDLSGALAAAEADDAPADPHPATTAEMAVAGAALDQGDAAPAADAQEMLAEEAAAATPAPAACHPATPEWAECDALA